MIVEQSQLRRRRGSSATTVWFRQRERGSLMLMRIMSQLSLRLGRRAARIALHATTAYFFLFSPGTRVHMRNYLRRALQREPTAADRYRQILSFASITHDRLYLMSGRFAEFEISSEGIEIVAERCRKGKGALLMGAHMGSFEVARALGRRQPDLNICLAMYEDNARKINSMFATVNPSLVQDTIPLGTMDSMLQIRARLDAGALVGILGDRTFGAERFIQLDFLGGRACFPTSAMRLAAILRCPVMFMAGLYRGDNRYHIVFDELTDFSRPTTVKREEAVRAAIARYAAMLEHYCTTDPYNWYNFFDFWQAPSAQATKT